MTQRNEQRLMELWTMQNSWLERTFQAEFDKNWTLYEFCKMRLAEISSELARNGAEWWEC
jgi:hypothetical protein